MYAIFANANYDFDTWFDTALLWDITRQGNNFFYRWSWIIKWHFQFLLLMQSLLNFFIWHLFARIYVNFPFTKYFFTLMLTMTSFRVIKLDLDVAHNSISKSDFFVGKFWPSKSNRLITLLSQWIFQGCSLKLGLVG